MSINRPKPAATQREPTGEHRKATSKRAGPSAAKKATPTKPSRGATKSGSRRKKPVDARRAALDVGRRLLTEGGPGALTLKAVAAELGTSHSNLIHHFGSAEKFQIELKRAMVEDLTRTVTDFVRQSADERVPDTQAIVDTVFAAYDTGGIGTMLAWSALARNDGNGEAVLDAVGELVAVLTPAMGGRGEADESKAGHDPGKAARALVRMVTLIAFADGLIGRGLSRALGESPDETRALTVKLATRLAWLEENGAADAIEP